LTDSLRKAVPGFNVTTDIIAGFPGESDEQWRESMDFIATQCFGHIHAFTYSERQGTKAASLPDPVPMAKRQARSRELHQLAQAMKLDRLDEAVGSQCDVLFENGKQVTTAQGSTYWQHQGYTPNYLRVVVQSPDNLANRIMKTDITGVEGVRLTAQLSAASDIAGTTTRRRQAVDLLG